MAIYRWFSRAAAAALLGALLMLTACSAGSQTGTGSATVTPPTPTPTPTTAAPTPTPTLAPPVCNANFPNPPVYYSTLPDASFKATNVFAQVPLPPLTREYDNDAAGGVRGRQLCSAGTTESVLSFMSAHLMQLGWQEVALNGSDCLTAASYGQGQCWAHGPYALFLGINSSADWLILFRDPDFM